MAAKKSSSGKSPPPGTPRRPSGPASRETSSGRSDVPYHGSHPSGEKAMARQNAMSRKFNQYTRAKAAKRGGK